MASEKYLAIRNWAKFQARTDKHGRSMDGRCRPYIRDYTDKECDSDYAALSFMTRYLLDACRRLRGKYGRNLRNDPMWILRQLDAPSTDRGRGVHGIETLVRRGFLIPTNQEFDSEQKPKTPLEIEVDLEVDVESQNTKASTSLMRSQNLISTSEAEPTATPKTNPAPLREKTNPDAAQPKNGRPVVTSTELEWIRQTAARFGLPPTVERDHAIGAQYIVSHGCDWTPIFDLLNARAAEGTENFTSIGEVFAAAISHAQYLAGRNLH
jgi:hypothetical protein